MESQHGPRTIAMAGHTGHAQVVIDALRSEDPTHRATALGAAARLKILTAEILLSALGDPEPTVRRRAAELSPGAIGEPSHQTITVITEALVELLADPTCAEVAANALGELIDLPPPILRQVVAPLERQASTHDDPLCRESAIAALGSLGQGRATVLAATEDVATVRRRAVIALANFEGPDVDAALERAVDDRDWQVRQAAEDLLR